MKYVTKLNQGGYKVAETKVVDPKVAEMAKMTLDGRKLLLQARLNKTQTQLASLDARVKKAQEKATKMAGSKGDLQTKVKELQDKLANLGKPKAPKAAVSK